MDRKLNRSWAFAAASLLIAWTNGLFADESFEERVAPILERRCLSCHDDEQRKGGFSLQSAQSAFADGYIEAGDAEASPLVSLITPADGEAEMPKNADPLSDGEIRSIRKWIDEGANWPKNLALKEPSIRDFDWWSYKPIRRPSVPETDPKSSWVRTPIDAFVLDQLEQRGLTHAGEADQRTLIRRVTFDLIGLPPTPEEVDAFLNDENSRAYEDLVDRLLDSKRYGERWARHWLDVVAYADSCGYDKDKLRENAWPYRDYVIRSFNEDKRYARFVQEQIAGDVLFPGERDGILGLGFIAAGPWDFIGHVEVPELKIDGKVARNLDRDDMVSRTVNTFCSLSVQCARCHHHKFDPITQEDYYGLQAIFAAVDRANRPYDVDPEVEQRRRQLESQLQSLESRLDAVREEIASAGGARLAELETQIAALPKGKMVYAAATHFEPQGDFQPTEGNPRPIHVLHRGDVQQPRDPARPGVLPLGREADWQLDRDLSEGERRAALAHWLTDKEHPLVWRSIVNRVWQYHFGQGIVATPNDFGRMGAEPTHPELLDWLASEFRDSGQSFKALHRLIVTSSVYRQSSQHNDANAAIDGSNQYLWRMNRRRLDAEEIRDAILTVSGALSFEMGGPGFYLFQLEKTEHSPHYEYQKFDPTDPASHRRSIYRFVARSQPNPWMMRLDCADSSQSTPRRNETLTSLQALSLLNNRFNLAMAERFAARLQEEASTLSEQVDRAVMLVRQRPPEPSERDELVAYARSYGLPNLCRFLFNLSEFVYLD